MANRARKVITGADALRQLHETMLRNRADIERVSSGDGWREVVECVGSGAAVNKMDIKGAVDLRLSRGQDVGADVLLCASHLLRPPHPRQVARLCDAIDGRNPIVGGITALCRSNGTTTSVVTRAWALGDLGLDEYVPLADALNFRVAKLSTVQTPAQATAESKARIEARQQHFDEVATKPPLESAAEVAVKGEPIAEPIKSAAQAKATYRAHVTLRSGGTLDVTASEISVDDSGVLLEGEGMSLALNSQAVAEVTIKWEVR